MQPLKSLFHIFSDRPGRRFWEPAGAMGRDTALVNQQAARLFIPLILMLPWLLFWRWLVKGEVLFWGTSLLQFWPWHVLVKTSVLAGEWPLWNPLLGNGAPLLANLQTAFFYPPNLLYLLLPVEHGLTLSVVLHLALAGLLMYLYTRHMGLLPFAATVAALAYMLSGYITGRTQFVTMVNAAAWLPLLLLLGEKAVTRPAGRITAGLALALAMPLLAGHAQLWFYSLCLLAAYMVWRSWQEAGESAGTGAGGLRRFLAAIVAAGWRLGLALGLTLLLAAAQWLPTAEFTLESSRGSGAERVFALTYSFWPWRLITLLAPDLFGHPAYGNYWGYANYWEAHAYVGVLPFVLALGAVWHFYRHSRRAAPGPGTEPAAGTGEQDKWLMTRLVPFFAGLVPVSLVLAMGWNTPVYLWIFDTVPGFGFFQAPARLLIWYTVAMSILAGVGAQVFEVAPASRRGWQRALVACLGLAVAAGAASFVLAGRSRTFLSASLVLGLLLAMSIGLLLRRPWPGASAGRKAAWQLLVVTFIAVDLLRAALPLNPTLPAAIYHSPIASAEFLKQQAGAYRFFVDDGFDYATKFDDYFPFHTFGPLDLAYWQGLKERLVPNFGVYAGLPAANNFDPLVVGRWQQLMKLVRQADEATRDRLLALMNVGYAVGSADKAGAAAIYRQDAMAIRAVPRPLPRAYFVARAYPARDEADTLARLTSPDFDSAREVVIMSNTSGSAAPSLPLPEPAAKPAAAARSVAMVEDGPNQVRLAVEAPEPGWVILADTFYPGWQVTVDGRPGQIWPANLAFRAVAVEAGTHELVFVYRPRSFVLGLWLSGLAWAIVGLGAILSLQPLNLMKLIRPRSPFPGRPASS